MTATTSSRRVTLLLGLTAIACTPGREAAAPQPVVVPVAAAPPSTAAAPAAEPAEGPIAVEVVALTETEPVKVEASFPRMTSSHPSLGRALAAVSAEIEDSIRSDIRSFVEGALPHEGHELTFHCDASLLAPPLIGLSCHRWSYEGGAHGFAATDGKSFFLVGDTHRPVAWNHLVDADRLAELSALCLEELEEQGAEWVTSGELDALDREALSAFSLSPAGVTFHFAPYLVGPYAQGTFEVLVPWRRMLDLMPASSPVRGAARQLRDRAAQTCATRGGTCMEGCEEGTRDVGQGDCYDSTCCVPEP